MHGKIAGPIVVTATLGLTLSGCHPYGCGSSKCVTEHEYADAKRCSAVLDASLEIMQTAHLPKSATFDPGAVQAQAIESYDAAVRSGAELGLPQAVILKDVEHAKAAYLKSYRDRPASNAQVKLRTVFDDLNSCVKEDPNA